MRLHPSPTDGATDAGYPGSRVAPIRLAPSLVAPVQGATGGTVNIPEGTGARFIANAAPTASVSLVVTYANGKSLTLTFGPGGKGYFRSADGIASITWTAAAPAAWLVVDTGVETSSADAAIAQVVGNAGLALNQDGTDANLITMYGGPQAFDDEQTAGPSSIGPATIETVLQAGANVVGKGHIIEYHLSMIGPLVTTSDILTYLALKGHASGIYYASAGPGASVYGRKVMAQAGGEKLDLVSRNQDTVAKGNIGYWLGYGQ